MKKIFTELKFTAQIDKSLTKFLRSSSKCENLQDFLSNYFLLKNFLKIVVKNDVNTMSGFYFDK